MNEVYQPMNATNRIEKSRLKISTNKISHSERIEIAIADH
jgi:hypothetical protein